MKKSILDIVVDGLDKVDDCMKDDVGILSERLQERVFKIPELAGALTEKQKQAVIAACQETLYAASILARAYAFTAVSEFIRASDQ